MDGCSCAGLQVMDAAPGPPVAAHRSHSAVPVSLPVDARHLAALIWRDGLVNVHHSILAGRISLQFAPASSDAGFSCIFLNSPSRRGQRQTPSSAPHIALQDGHGARDCAMGAREYVSPSAASAWGEPHPASGRTSARTRRTLMIHDGRDDCAHFLVHHKDAENISGWPPSFD